MIEKKLPPPSDTDEDFLSSSSSEKGSMFPPISSKHMKQPQLYSDTKSKLSVISGHKIPSK